MKISRNKKIVDSTAQVKKKLGKNQGIRYFPLPEWLENAHMMH